MIAKIVFLVSLLVCFRASADEDSSKELECTDKSCDAERKSTWFDYTGATDGTKHRSAEFFSALPGYTRSVVKDKYALITPESHVFGNLPGWSNVAAACLMSPALGCHFSMYLVHCQEGATGKTLGSGTERFMYVLSGNLSSPSSQSIGKGGFAYVPAGYGKVFTCSAGTKFLVYDRVYEKDYKSYRPSLVIGNEDDVEVELVPGEVFQLRRLLPKTNEFDFNIHVMDFKPGEFLNVKEVHYNQHGLFLLQGMGIYRLGDEYYPVTAGDAIYMAPFVPQWFGALGPIVSRYIIYKDTNRDPLTA